MRCTVVAVRDSPDAEVVAAVDANSLRTLLAARSFTHQSRRTLGTLLAARSIAHQPRWPYWTLQSRVSTLDPVVAVGSRVVGNRFRVVHFCTMAPRMTVSCVCRHAIRDD